jgi:hypothetical protein
MTQRNGDTEDERRHAGDALRATAGRMAGLTGMARSLRLISVSPLLRVDPFPP